MGEECWLYFISVDHQVTDMPLLLARTLSEYYKITKWEITISCDNKGALDCLSYQLRRIKPSAKCADIRRSFRSTKLGLSGKLIYEHVYGHMDDYLNGTK